MEGPILLLSVNRDSELSLTQQVYQQLRERILSEELLAGERLPASRSLAQQLAISRNVVTAAYEQLIAEGYLESRTGAGSYVAGELPERALHAIQSASEPEPARAANVKLSAAAQRLIADRQQSVALNLEHHGRLNYEFRYGGGAIDERALAIWRKLLGRATREVSDFYENPQGDQRLREAIARHLRQARRCQLSAGQIVIVNGSQQALDTVARLILDEGDTVAVEDPGYRGSRQVFKTAGARVIGVPVDAEGLRVAELETCTPVPKIVYITPSHQLPTGVVLSLPRRLALLDWAQQNEAWLIEDDYDSEFHYTGQPLECVQGLDPYGRTIYVGTFSRSLAPSMRLGYVVLPNDLVEPFAAFRWMVDRQTNGLMQVALRYWFEEGHHEQHLRRLRKQYARRRDSLLHCLHRHFSAEEIDCVGTAAGLHVLVWMQQLSPEQNDQLVQLLRREGIGLYSASPTYMNEVPRAGISLGFTAIDEEKIPAGIAAFAIIYRKFLKSL